MRTRFLATDYFSGTSAREALISDFQVFSLPAPNLCSPDPFLGVDIPFLVSDFVQYEIDRFSFKEALTDFLSYVIPRNIGAGERCSSDGCTGMRFCPFCESDHEEISFASSNMVDIKRADGSFYEEMEVEKSLEFHSSAFVANLLEFEIAELEEFSMCKLGVSSKGIDATLFFDIPGVSVPVDKVHVDMGISIASQYEVDRLLCLIEDVAENLYVSQESSTTKYDNSLQDKKVYYATKSPSFEVCEIDLGLHEFLFMDETLNDLLAYLMPNNNVDESVFNGKDFLGSTDANVTGLTQYVSEYGLEHKLLSLNPLLELDQISLSDIILLEKQSVYPVLLDEIPHFPCATQLEEVQIFDKASVNVSDMHNYFETVKKIEFFEQMGKEEIGYMSNFYESVLTSELSLKDDTFRLLPVPCLSDEKALKPDSMIGEDIFNALKPHTFSVCDEIYLDWHPLLEGFCNNETCSIFRSMTQEISSYRIDSSELNSQYENIMLSVFDFINESSSEVSILQFKEKLTDVHRNCPDTLVPATDNDVTEIVSHELKESDGAKMSKENPAKIPESLSQFNDLNFFLGVRKDIAELSSVGTSNANKPGSHITSGDTLKEPSEPAHLPEPNNQKIEVHKASLPGYTLGLIDQIQGIYFLNLNKCKHLISSSSLPTIEDYELLSIPKVRLLELISEKGRTHYALGSRDEAFVALLAIYAVKQLVYYLCFFGYHIAYIYVSNCLSKVDDLAAKLQPLQSLLQDAHSKVEKQIIDSHPSLNLIEGLLRSNASQGYQKTLIISDEVFWPSLKHKLAMLKISFIEVNQPYCPAELLDNLDSNSSLNSISEALSISDCLLLNYGNISASFPFNMFINILEYGGPRATSKISDIFSCSGGFPRVHFIRLDIENHHFARALCKGFDTSKKHMISTEGFPRYMVHLLGCLYDDNTDGQLRQLLLDNACSCEPVGTIEASHGIECTMNKLHLSNSNKATAKAFSVPEVVVIVNTQNLGKNMIMSRRSSYQKILALEKSGVQVVERDINLPLDLIFSPSICLVWYEARNTTDKMEVVSGISAVLAFIEIIATKILISLCSSFSGCILIFEGESNFLASILEASDMLYAAAASLDLNLQLFCSHMPETTDEIILNCIKTTNIADSHLFSAMPESESIAESFLTRFPSLNPFSAHAILSSGGMLIEFLEWSHERRIQIIGKYKVPAESISLFNALCRYGELGESKSVMTDCSSIDSENSGAPLQPKRKLQRYGISSCRPDMLMDESFYVEPGGVDQSPTGPNQMNYSSSGLLQPSQQYCSNNFRFHGVPEKTQLFSNAETRYKINDANYLKRNNIGGDKWTRHNYPHDDFHNNVIDYNPSFLDQHCASIPRNTFNPRRSELICEPSIENFLSSRRLSDGYTRTFPSSADINCAENDLTNSSKRNFLKEESCEPKSAFFNKELFNKRNLLHQKHTDSLGLLTNANANKVPSLSEFLHSSASRPSQQGGQRDVFKSLGEANERSRAYPRSSCNTCLNCSGRLKRKATYQKKSPSVIDSFRFQGGSKQARDTVSKRMNLTRAGPSSQVADIKDSPLIKPSWTPIDKRARQDLSFMRTGNGQQSRLVWRRSESPRVSCGLRKRQRDDF